MQIINYLNVRQKIIPGAYSGWQGTSVTIPNSVIEIGEHAFYSSGIQTIDIPQFVKIIRENAFAYCQRLESISIPDSVEIIGFSSFSSCLNLSNVVIGNSVKEIGQGAFSNCPSLKYVNIPSSVHKIEMYAFECQISLNGYDCEFYNFDVSKITCAYEQVHNDLIPVLKYYNERFESLDFIVPANIKKICSGAFYECNLRKIHLSNVVEIGSSAFALCTNLESIDLPDTLTIINDYAFAGCESLLNLNLPSHLEYFGTDAIYGTKITKLVVPDSVEDYKNQGIDLDYLKMPAKTKVIGINNAASAKTVVLPEYLEIIEEQAFLFKEIETIYFPKNTIKRIENDAFHECSQLTNLIFQGNIEYFGEKCFANTNIAEIIIPSNAIFCYNALEGCSNLKRISFGDVKLSISSTSGYFDAVYKMNIIEIEVHYTGDSTNDYDVNAFFYGLVSNFAKVVYVPDSYELDTFCTKNITKAPKKAQTFDIQYQCRYKFIVLAFPIMYTIYWERNFANYF